MNYDVNYFIKKFEAIPENKWCIGTQDDGNGNRCAYGWCGNADWVRENFSYWELGTMQEWILTHEDNSFEVIIAHP